MTYGNVKNLVRRHWERRAAEFDQKPSHGLLNDAQHQAWRLWLDSVAGPEPLDVLDIGCGTGFLALLFAELGHRAVGVDFSPAMLQEARSKAVARGLPVRFSEGDAEAPPADLGNFDLIAMRHLVWTLPNPQEAARTWRAMLRPGGRLLLIEGQFKGGEMKEEYQQIGDRLPFLGGRPSKDVEHLLATAGLVEVRTVSLMDPDLWLEPPSFPRYAVFAARQA